MCRAGLLAKVEPAGPLAVGGAVAAMDDPLADTPADVAPAEDAPPQPESMKALKASRSTAGANRTLARALPLISSTCPRQ